MPRTDKEIKEWIDGIEVLTIYELTRFIYPNWSDKSVHQSYKNQLVKIRVWWDYTLKTKDWVKLREYKELKIKRGNFNADKFSKFKEIYYLDERARTFGRRRLQKLLKKKFNLNVSQAAIERYKKICIQESS